MHRLAIVIGALSLVAAACSGGSADPTTTTTTTQPMASTSTTTPSTMVVTPEQTTSSLEIWAPASLIGPIGDAAAAYEIETGIGVDVTPTDIDTMLETLLDDPAAGPDLFVGPHEWLTALTDAGIAEPITVDPTVVAGAAAGVALRGSTYAAPIGLDTLVQFRNPTALGSSPATVEDFADGCVVSGSTVPCLVLSTRSVEGHWPFITALGGYLFGPDEFDGWDKDDVGIDTAEAIAGGLVLEEVAEGTGILGDGSTAAHDRFVAGDAPLFWGTADDLAALELEGVQFTVEELPTIGALPAAGPVETMALWVNAFSVDKEAATELVTGYLAVPEGARPMAVALGLAPVDVDYADDPDLVPFMLQARVGLPVPPIAATELAWTELATAFDAIRSGTATTEALGGAASTIRAGA